MRVVENLVVLYANGILVVEIGDGSWFSDQTLTCRRVHEHNVLVRDWTSKGDDADWRAGKLGFATGGWLESYNIGVGTGGPHKSS